MAYIEFDDLRQRGDLLGAGIIQAMSGMHFETQTFGELRPGADTIPLRLRLLPSARQRIAPCTGMNLDHQRADFRRCLDLLPVSSKEKRNANASALQFAHRLFDLTPAADYVQAAFGRALGAFLRHQASGVWQRFF